MQSPNILVWGVQYHLWLIWLRRKNTSNTITIDQFSSQIRSPMRKARSWTLACKQSCHKLISHLMWISLGNCAIVVDWKPCHQSLSKHFKKWCPSRATRWFLLYVWLVCNVILETTYGFSRCLKETGGPQACDIENYQLCWELWRPSCHVRPND